MKRLIPATLKTFLASTPNVLRADCFALELPNGQTMYMTDGQWDITFLATTPGWNGSMATFRAGTYGQWSRGAITSEAGTALSANTMELSCQPNADSAYPGLDAGILNAAMNHLFDGATVWVYTAYMPIGKYGDVSNGVETKWQGLISKPTKLTRVLVEFDCFDPFGLLNMKVPSRLVQSNCPWAFADTNCGLAATDYTATFAAAAASTRSTLVPGAAFTQAAGYFTQGVITCLSGANKGLSNTVKLHNGSLTMMVQWLADVVAGDTFAVMKGCDKTPATCAATKRIDGTTETQDYRLRFGGQPFTPAPAVSI